MASSRVGRVGGKTQRSRVSIRAYGIRLAAAQIGEAQGDLAVDLDPHRHLGVALVGVEVADHDHGVVDEDGQVVVGAGGQVGIVEVSAMPARQDGRNAVLGGHRAEGADDGRIGKRISSLKIDSPSTIRQTFVCGGRVWFRSSPVFGTSAMWPLVGDLDVADLDDERIARQRAVDRDRTGQRVAHRKREGVEPILLGNDPVKERHVVRRLDLDRLADLDAGQRFEGAIPHQMEVLLPAGQALSCVGRHRLLLSISPANSGSCPKRVGPVALQHRALDLTDDGDPSASSR